MAIVLVADLAALIAGGWWARLRLRQAARDRRQTRAIVRSFLQHKRNALPLVVAELREAVLKRIPHIFLSVCIKSRKDANLIDGHCMGFGSIHFALITPLSFAARRLTTKAARRIGQEYLYIASGPCDLQTSAQPGFRNGQALNPARALCDRVSQRQVRAWFAMPPKR